MFVCLVLVTLTIGIPTLSHSALLAVCLLLLFLVYLVSIFCITYYNFSKIKRQVAIPKRELATCLYFLTKGERPVIITGR